MTAGRLVVQSLRFFWRSHLGVFLGAALAAAILTGALAVGDSVRHSLRRTALARIGGVELALFQPGRFFRETLGETIAQAEGVPVAAAVFLRGAALSDSGETRVGRVQTLGVDDSFWRLGGAKSAPLKTADGSDGVALNEPLARALAAKVGDEVLLRIDKPSLLSRDAPLSTLEDATVALRLPVTAIVEETGFGHFSLEANQIPPRNAFVARAVLQRAVGMEGRANLLLAGTGKTPVAPADATRALWQNWTLADSGLTLRAVPGQNVQELRTDRVFLDPPVGEAAKAALPGAQGVLTYFVNELRVGQKATPYSTVAALDGPLIPAGMHDDEALINRWLADDLGAKPGDTLTLRYWLVGPMRRLEERRGSFRIRAILPLDGLARDPALMPDIPGLADKKDCREWEPGVPIDLTKIRDRDQAYWSAYRGTPKAFLTLKAGQRLWNNRFGDLTAVRYPASSPAASATIEACLRQALSPAALGLFFVPVRERVLTASATSLDFGQLFLGFSVFLIVAALLLAALLFGFGVEQRAEEIGTLRALGFPPGRIRRLLLLEGGSVALAASLLGTLAATAYTRAVVGGLSTVWRGAVANSPLRYHAEPTTLLLGAAASFLVALATIFLVARRQANAPARELLAGGVAETMAAAPNRRRASLWTAGVSMALAIGLAIVGRTAQGESAAALFFSAGAALLVAGIAVCRALLAALAPRQRTISALGIRNAVRRPGRSLGAIALLACGSFLVIAIGANRHDPGEGARLHTAGTGGFALYGESSLPVYEDLNGRRGREAFGLDDAALAGTNLTALRLREGDEASCLNLNRAQTPRLLGIDPAALEGRFTFAQASGEGGWRALDRRDPDGAIPVIGDTNTVVWSLGKQLGDIVPYTDDRGGTHRLRIVGVLANSVLQGGLVLSETNFTRLFPTASGYQVFLIDAPEATKKAVSGELTRALEDVGLSVTSATERLAAFQTVENTYLSIFAILGGLGLLLGSLGLGVIVWRNVWERRSELALLRAVGFGTPALRGLIFCEHVLLLALGLAVGVAAALVAVLPSLRTPGAEIPYLSLGVTLLALLVSGFVWTGAAAALALRSPLLAALRNE